MKTRPRARRLTRGAAIHESIVVLAILGLGAMGAFIAAGTQLHRDYRASRTLLASPYP